MEKDFDKNKFALPPIGNPYYPNFILISIT